MEIRNGGLTLHVAVDGEPDAPPAASSPHARINVVKGASHLIHDERAYRQQFLDEVVGFLADLDD